ncbi:MAG: histidine phosphatase family protein [Bacilli bacterium]
MKLFIIRHGTTQWNKEKRSQGQCDIPLDAEGMQQARKLQEELKSLQPDVIFSSDLKRAYATAECLAANWPGVVLIKDEILREVSGGEIDGTTQEERVAKWGEDIDHFALGKERPEQVLARITPFVTYLEREYSNKVVVCVTHGALIAQMLKHLVPHENIVGKVGNTAVTTLEKKEEWTLVTYNCMKHL